MCEDQKDNSEKRILLRSFLEHNLPIITIIGVFGALSFFSITDSDQDLIFISILLSIIVLFLSLNVLFDGMIRIWNELKQNFGTEDFFKYLRKSIKSVNLIIFLTVLFLFILLFVSYLNLHEVLYFRVLLLLIILIVDVIISAITIPYILVKENSIKNVALIFITTLIIILIVGSIFGLFDPLYLSIPHHDIEELISLRNFILFLLIVPMFLWVTAFVKLGILLHKYEM